MCIKFFNINDMREREERERFSTTGLINVQGFVEVELKRQKNYLICLPAIAQQEIDHCQLKADQYLSWSHSSVYNGWVYSEVISHSSDVGAIIGGNGEDWSIVVQRFDAKAVSE